MMCPNCDNISPGAFIKVNLAGCCVECGMPVIGRKQNKEDKVYTIEIKEKKTILRKNVKEYQRIHSVDALKTLPPKTEEFGYVEGGEKEEEVETTIYRQTVVEINLPAIITAINPTR